MVGWVEECWRSLSERNNPTSLGCLCVRWVLSWGEALPTLYSTQPTATAFHEEIFQYVPHESKQKSHTALEFVQE